MYLKEGHLLGRCHFTGNMMATSQNNMISYRNGIHTVHFIEFATSWDNLNIHVGPC